MILRPLLFSTRRAALFIPQLPLPAPVSLLQTLRLRLNKPRPSLLRLTLPTSLAIGLTLTLSSSLNRPTIHFDAPPSPSSPPSPPPSPSTSSPSPLPLPPKTLTQISLGSILGLGTGILISAFSRPLSLLFGISIVVVQYAASKGYHIVPTGRLKAWARETVGGDRDRGERLGRVIEWLGRDVAFKVAFGVCCGLAGWGEF